MKKYFSIIVCIFFNAAALHAQTNLFIPPVMNGPTYNLTMQNGTKQFNPGITSATKGFNGNILGPTLIMNAGEVVHMNVTNNIGEETTVHWHGFHISPENDGGPHTIIDPNTTWSPSFTVAEKAGTYWYHPHAHETTAKQVLQGLAGLIIVRDNQEAGLALPRTYGVDDFPLIIQTKAINDTGKILFDGREPNNDVNLMVNGTKNASLDVPKQMVRFRILNGAHQRVFNLGLSNNGVFYNIATDGGLKSNRAAITRLRLAPGERAEIVIPFDGYFPNTTLQLKSYGNELPNGIWGATNAWINNPVFIVPPGYSPNPMNGAEFTVLKFRVVNATSSPVLTIPPVNLATVVPIPEAQATNTREKWLFSGNGLNGVLIGNTSAYTSATTFDLNTVNDVINLGATEIWTFHGAKDQYHPIHIHDVQFFILDRKDSLGNNVTLKSSEVGRKDVVLIGPKETVRFIAKFDDFWGDVPYMYHCHINVHEDKGMMKQFVVNKSYYLDKDFIGSIEQGTLFRPFKTLRTAAAEAIEGSTINVMRSGTHEEIGTTSIVIKKKIKIKPNVGTVIFQ